MPQKQIVFDKIFEDRFKLDIDVAKKIFTYVDRLLFCSTFYWHFTNLRATTQKFFWLKTPEKRLIEYITDDKKWMTEKYSEYGQKERDINEFNNDHYNIYYSYKRGFYSNHSHNSSYIDFPELEEVIEPQYTNGAGMGSEY